MSELTLAARPAPGDALCRLDELDADLGTLRLIWHEWDQPTRVFLVRRGEAVHAYLNRCPHALAHLDHPPGNLFNHDRQYLQCSFHGARFRIEDGYCVFGPCRDRRLTAFPIRLEDGVIYAGEPAKPAYDRSKARVRLARGHKG